MSKDLMSKEELDFGFEHFNNFNSHSDEGRRHSYRIYPPEEAGRDDKWKIMSRFRIISWTHHGFLMAFK